jgi:hypothetical protein
LSTNIRCGFVERKLEAQGAAKYVIYLRTCTIFSRFSSVNKAILDATTPSEQHRKNELYVNTHLLVFWVFRTENVDPPFPSDNAATIAHHLDRRANLHASYQMGCLRKGWGYMAGMKGCLRMDD